MHKTVDEMERDYHEKIQRYLIHLFRTEKHRALPSHRQNFEQLQWAEIGIERSQIALKSVEGVLGIMPPESKEHFDSVAKELGISAEGKYLHEPHTMIRQKTIKQIIEENQS